VADLLVHRSQEEIDRQVALDRRRRRVRTVLGRGGAYLALGFFALVMVFPFVYMAASALKTPEDTFRYPPRVLPRAPETAEIDGEAVPLFALPIDGEVREVYLVEPGVEAGVFVDPDDPGTELAWPLELAADTGRTVDVGGESLPLSEVTVGSEVLELAYVRNTSVGRFAATDDPNLETFAVVRTAPRAETVSARWENFSDVIGLRNLDRALTNTILVTLLVVAGSLFTSIMGGYAFARIRFPGRDQLFVGYLGSIMIPFIVLIIPLYQFMVGLGWINHLGVLVWPFVYTAYGTFLMRQFFIAIPKDLEEAAFIDGARRWRILWRVFVPLAWPGIATLATFQFLYAWNSFIWPLVSINVGNVDNHVLTLALQQLGGQSVEAPNLIFAGITLAVIVPFVVFIAAQRYFVENVATSGIK
jgi:ABC-type glycerol-3-phosphate transport system permease component